MYWDPRDWHRHMLGPAGLALGHAGTHGPSAGTSWAPHSQRWDVLDSTAPALRLNWVPWLLYWGLLGP